MAETNYNIGFIVSLIVAVAVAILVLIFIGTLGGQVYNLQEQKINALITSVVNESFTPLNSTAVFLANNNLVSGTLTILNSSRNVGLGNFSINYDTGSLTLKNNAYNNTALDVSYQYGDIEILDAITGGSVSSFEALETTGNYLPIIVLAFVVVFVLGLVMGFSNMTTKGGGGAL
jgi:hypothetical protein